MDSGKIASMKTRSRKKGANQDLTAEYSGAAGRSDAAGQGKGTRRRGRPRGRKQDEGRPDRAEALMAAALNLFAERNFASVTIKDIANTTGVNTALIYYYFDSKKDLFQRTIENAVENAFTNFEDFDPNSDKPAEVITSWLNNHLYLYDRIHKLVKVSLDYKGAPDKDPAIDRAIQHFYDRERELLSDCIRAGVKKGIFKPVKPEKIAEYISTYLDGAMVRAVILPDFDLASAVQDLRGITWDLLGYSSES
jgi:AcrR family transcriptional regulator